MMEVLRWVFVGTVLAVGLLLLFTVPGKSQQHYHPPEHAALHEQFYNTWRMPDDPNKSCCNLQDCAPAQAQFRNGQWYAKRENDIEWRAVPPSKVETNRDTPDGRNHLCAPWGNNHQVYCFISGAGG